MTSEILDEAYVRLHDKGPEFGGDEEGNHGLTNHGPMVAEVVVRRGLDLDVQRWLDHYVLRLEELPTGSEPISEQTWRSALGDGRRIGDWTSYFTARLGEQPWRQVLATWWPRLLPGIAAGATHGVIRVGHAVRALTGGTESPAAVAELGYGLAFWAARSRLLPGLPSLGAPPAPTPAPVRGPFTRLSPGGGHPHTLRAAEALAGVPRLVDQSGLIAHRLQRLAELRGWTEALSALTAPEDPADVPARLADLVRAGVFGYLSHGQASPVLLVHTATAPAAVLHTLPVLPEELWVPSFTAAWAASAAITAAYAPARPEPARVPPTPGGTDPATEMLGRAGLHGDEHVIKFTDTAVEVFDQTGDPDALAAAVRAGELIDPRRACFARLRHDC